MNQDRIEEEIGNCTEILHMATRLLSSKIRNGIYRNVGDYRQALRMQLYEQEVKNDARNQTKMEITAPAD